MDSDFLLGFLGGCLIGVGTLLGMAATGKVPGISGVFARVLLPKKGDLSWRLWFLGGLIGGASLLFAVSDHANQFRVPDGRSWLVIVLAGLIVGFGTRLGGGCTSGHGICGSGMGAKDSMAATVIFMAAGMATVFLFRMITA